MEDGNKQRKVDMSKIEISLMAEENEMVAFKAFLVEDPNSKYKPSKFDFESKSTPIRIKFGAHTGWEPGNCVLRISNKDRPDPLPIGLCKNCEFVDILKAVAEVNSTIARYDEEERSNKLETWLNDNPAGEPANLLGLPDSIMVAGISYIRENLAVRRFVRNGGFQDSTLFVEINKYNGSSCLVQKDGKRIYKDRENSVPMHRASRYVAEGIWVEV